MPVPQYDLSRQHAPIQEELRQAFQRVLDSGIYVSHWGDAEVAALEREVAGLMGILRAVGCASGTDALVLLYRALGLGPGDEIVVPAFTFLATGSSCLMAGAKPVFADVDLDHYCLTAESVEAALTPDTKAIVVAHLFGQLAEGERIAQLACERGLLLLEDAAQAIGATRNGEQAGAWGLAATLSFFPTKNLGAVGDAGMIVTADNALADNLVLLRNHGSPNGILGDNSRLDELQAALLRVKLPLLQQWNDDRRRVAEHYREGLADLESERFRLPAVLPGNHHVFHQYVVRVKDRARVQASLRERGVSSGVYYPVPLHRHPMLATTWDQSRGLPHAERLAEEVLALPVFPGMTDDESEEVVAALRQALTAG